jgi:hypothetical protein
MDEPNRLLEAGEYRAAVIAAITLLETSLRDRLKEHCAIIFETSAANIAA